MRKVFIVVTVVIAVFICNNCATYKGYYEGHIYTPDGHPVPNLRVHPDRMADSIGITDENGYFKFERAEGWNSVFLEVEFEGKIIDTIRTLRRWPHGNHILLFNEERKDTLFIDIKRKKEAIAPMDSNQEQTDVNLDDIEMVYVEGGTFTMGCTKEQGEDLGKDWDKCWEDEKPARKVTVGSFYIGKYEVTQGLWKKVMEYNPSYFKGDNLPVEMVTWNGWNAVQTFIERLNEKTGKKYRLPTEAEWEYAARGGNKSKGYKYSGSNDSNEVAWYHVNSERKTHPVGTKKPNELGIYDMSGNVYEWVNDWYGPYDSYEQINPAGPSSGFTRVIRGGGWISGAPLACRVAARIYGNPIGRNNRTGFRLALDP
jgi:formylglycine-generating enzyme required for sulfatase activity